MAPKCWTAKTSGRVSQPPRHSQVHMAVDGVQKLLVLVDQYGMLVDVSDILHAVAVKLLPEVVDDGDEAVVAGGLEVMS